MEWVLLIFPSLNQVINQSPFVTTPIPAPLHLLSFSCPPHTHLLSYIVLTVKVIYISLVLTSDFFFVCKILKM